jgi:hypothetical protein
MPIVAGELILRLSGGAGNTVPNSSLGGAKSTTAVTDNTLHNLFDVVSSAESTAGDVEYRCVYLHNANATLTLSSAYAYILTQTPAAGSDAAIAVGTSPVNGSETSIPNENTAPAGVTWVTGTGSGNAIALGNIPAGQHRAFWIRRTITAGASAYTNDSVVIQVGGDTPA